MRMRGLAGREDVSEDGGGGDEEGGDALGGLGFDGGGEDVGGEADDFDVAGEVGGVGYARRFGQRGRWF